MKRLFLFLITALTTVGVAAGELPQITNVLSRQTTSLNGDWHYIVDVQEVGYRGYRMDVLSDGFFKNRKPQKPEELIEYDFDKAPVMQIPSDWNTRDERLFFYEGTVWFQKSFNYHPVEGRRTLLYFGAVNYEAIVYVNGERVGSHVGGFTPFNFDVTDQLRDGENFVVVKVDNKRHAEDVPMQIFDWWNYGGITRDVLLVDVSEVYVQQFSLQMDKNYFQQQRTKARNSAAAAKKARKSEQLLNFSVSLNHPVAGEKVTLNIPELKVKQTVTTDNEGKASVQLKAKPELWSPESPKRYAVTVEYCGETISDEIGFRVVGTKGKQLLLNGEPIFLRGISIHEEKPYGGGRANSTSDAHTLLSWAKELGCNFVRLAHYPHNEYAVSEAERMGIMVWSEIPVYWCIDWKTPDTYANAQRQLHDMITRDQNRAAILIWSIANETPHSSERDTFLGSLANYARTLDNTRLISMAMEVTSASNFHNKLQDNMHEFVDVVSFNEYIGWYRDVSDAAKMTWEIPYDKPVIISEFGGGARQGYHGSDNQRWTEEFQERLYMENTAMLDKIDGLAGTTPWILKDFRSPRRVLNGTQDYYNRKGLVGDNGQKKKAFYVLQEWYSNKR